MEPVSSRSGTHRAGGLAALLAGGIAACSGEPAVLEARPDSPRAYGYHVGDRVVRQVELSVPAGLTLDADSLPRVGQRGRALELRSLTHDRSGLRLEYQVMLSPPESRTLEMPPLRLRYLGSGQDRELRVEAWPVTVSPLVPVEVSERDGLGDLRPDAAPPHADAGAAQHRLAAYAAVAVLAVGLLLHRYVGLPWQARRRRPFAVAWRVLRRLPASPDPEQGRHAMTELHAALNRCAGQVLFESGVASFVRREPRYAPVAPEISEFFRRSRELFFRAGDAAPVDGDWLRALSRRLRDAERGMA